MPRPVRTDIVQPDGRHVYLYGDFEPAPDGYRAPAMPNGVYQRRWNPLRREWVLVAASRQARTFLPERADCPLCPSRPDQSTEIPAARFQAAVFENRFPAMVPWPPAGGLCEVVVYTDEHDGSFASLPSERLDRLAEVWTDRYRELTARRGIKYVFIFENRGEQVGVTLHHPHGQIYAYPFIPPVPATELGRHAGGCLQCELVRGELTARQAATWQGALVLGPVAGGFLYVVDPWVPFAAAAVLISLAAVTILVVRVRPFELARLGMSS